MNKSFSYSLDIAFFPFEILLFRTQSNCSLPTISMQIVLVKNKFMKTQRNLGLTFIFSIFFLSTMAQTQVVKGKVNDAKSNSTLIGVTVIVANTDPLIGTTTDLDGNFKIESVPIGRHELIFKYLGYKSTSIPNVMVTAGKEVILNVQMEESVKQLKQFVVTADSEKDRPNNDLAKVSARTFDLEQVNRFSGGRNDVARLVTNFAGVSAPNDSRNDIVVRGNSPTGLLWRIEGIPIQTTNHFATLGTTGGPVSALNTNLLRTSDFITGAFPAEYGNANSAVFDIKLRKGNTETTEFTGQIAFTGAELMAEGPINKEKQTSYLVSYRYGLARFAATGTSAIPLYQDLMFNVDLGMTPLGRVSVFGLLGNSSIDFFGDEIDPNDLFADPDQDAFVKNGLGMVGMSLLTTIDETSYLKTSLGTSFIQNSYKQDNLMRSGNGEVQNKYRATEVDDTEQRYTLTTTYNKKYSARYSMRTGAIAELFDINSDWKDRDSRVDIPDEDNDGVPDYFLQVRKSEDQFLLLQGFTQGEYKFTDELSLTAGIHAQYLEYNSDLSIEPRAAIAWNFFPTQTLSFAYGLHSQMNPLPVLLLAEEQPNGEIVRTNEELNFVKSHHYVLAYDWRMGRDWRWKTEVYYQDIFDVPVEQISSSYSTINEGADFVFSERGNLVNEGVANNYGVELTLEKFFSRGFYGLATSSIYESKYKGSDGIERSTAFNNQLVGNLLLGKEWKIGKAKRNAFTMDTKITGSNGQPFTPINLEATRENGGREVLYEDRAYSERYDDYFRWDFKVGVILNSSKRKLSQQFSIDFQNLTNRENEFVRRYNAVTDEIDTITQIGFFPNILYVIRF